MFKVGEIVICKNSDNLRGTGLTQGKRYKVIHHSRLVWIIDNRDWLHSYSKNRFMSLLEDRKIKIQQICSKLEIK